MRSVPNRKVRVYNKLVLVICAANITVIIACIVSYQKIGFGNFLFCLGEGNIWREVAWVGQLL